MALGGTFADASNFAQSTDSTSTMSAEIALLTDRRYTASTAAPGDWYQQNILADDGLLQAALQQRGFQSVRLDWADPQVDWSRFRCAVFRTTWDYFDRFSEFTRWLDRIERQTELINPAATVRWNMDKHYLADLKSRSVPVVPTRYLEAGQPVDLAALLAETGWVEAVVKPCVSGAARHTYRVNAESLHRVEPIVQELVAREAMMLQPFQRGIVETGEDTLMIFGGKFTHAVRKVAKRGDFRVQDDFGGTVHPLQPTAEQIALAERAMQVCEPLPVYGRVDLVRGNDGQWAIMEMEIIEPELWLRMHPPAAEVFAEAIAERLQARK
jgi:glutathione synthase/RimK-type ligase-like ATP-grasp enzyme